MAVSPRKEDGRSRWRPDVAAPAWAVVWAAAGAVLCGAMIPLEPSFLEEGLIVHVAQRLAAGEHLYRDIESFTGPFPFVLLEWLFRIFGEKIMVARGALVVFHGVACAAIFDLFRRGDKRVLSHVAAAWMAAAPILLFPLYSTYFYTTLVVHLCLIAAWAAMLGTRSVRFALLAGAVVSCVALTKQTQGVALAPSLFLALVLGSKATDRMRNGLGMLGGSVAVALAVLTKYQWNGDLGVVIESLVVIPLSLGETFTSPYLNMWPIGEFSAAIEVGKAYYLPHLYNILSSRPGRVPVWLVVVTQILYALPFLALAATALKRLRAPLGRLTLIHGAVLVAVTSNLFPRPDWGHLVFVLPSALAQLVLLVDLERSGAVAVRAASIGSIALIVALAGGSFWVGSELHAKAMAPNLGPRVPISAVSPFAKSRGVPRVIEFLLDRVEPEEAIFVARSEPLIYFATDTRNPTRYSGVIPASRERQEREIVAALADVRYVVMSQDNRAQFLYYADELPAVQIYLERYFQVPEEYRYGPGRWIIVLERGPDRGATSVDLLEARPHAETWVRDEVGRRESRSEEAPHLASQQNRRVLPIWLGPGGGGVDYEMIVPEAAVFQADVGFAQVVGTTRSYVQAPNTRFSVSIVESGEGLGSESTVGGGSKEKATRLIDLPLKKGLFRWTAIELDLSAHAGRQVTLRLEVSGPAPFRDGSWAFWGSPRVALRP